METTTEKLVFDMQTDAQTEFSFTVPDVRSDVDAETASSVIDAIIAENVLMDDEGNLAAVAKSCDRVTTTTTPLWEG